jgi:cell division protein FtsL
MYAQKKSIENAHIVRERDRQRFRELFAVLALGIPVGLFLLLFTWQNLEVIRLGHEASSLQNQRKQIENEYKALQFQLDRLTSLHSVEQKATVLGFERTDPRIVVMVDRSPSAVGRSPRSSNTVNGQQPTANGGMR